MSDRPELPYNITLTSLSIWEINKEITKWIVVKGAGGGGQQHVSPGGPDCPSGRWPVLWPSRGNITFELPFFDYRWTESLSLSQDFYRSQTNAFSIRLAVTPHKSQQPVSINFTLLDTNYHRISALNSLTVHKTRLWIRSTEEKSHTM